MSSYSPGGALGGPGQLIARYGTLWGNAIGAYAPTRGALPTSSVSQKAGGLIVIGIDSSGGGDGNRS
jgi:hypothetical protein